MRPEPETSTPSTPNASQLNFPSNPCELVSPGSQGSGSLRDMLSYSGEENEGVLALDNSSNGSHNDTVLEKTTQNKADSIGEMERLDRVEDNEDSSSSGEPSNVEVEEEGEISSASSVGSRRSTRRKKARLDRDSGDTPRAGGRSRGSSSSLGSSSRHRQSQKFIRKNSNQS